jgi:[ribosomal protein S5]-alanine N-acetyltransferase
MEERGVAVPPTKGTEPPLPVSGTGDIGKGTGGNVPPQPTIRTRRLSLRPFTLADAGEVQRLGGDAEVSATALHVPYPMDLDAAVSWIRSHSAEYGAGTLAAFAIASAREGSLFGTVGLMIEPEHARAELGYWLGKPFWGRGYATEAATEVLRFGFEELHLRRIHANHLAGNPASGRVLEKVGMSPEGCLRQHAWHRGAFHDVVMYGIVRPDARSGLYATRSDELLLRGSIP